MHTHTCLYHICVHLSLYIHTHVYIYIYYVVVVVVVDVDVVIVVASLKPSWMKVDREPKPHVCLVPCLSDEV